LIEASVDGLITVDPAQALLQTLMTACAR